MLLLQKNSIACSNGTTCPDFSGDYIVEIPMGQICASGGDMLHRYITNQSLLAKN